MNFSVYGRLLLLGIYTAFLLYVTLIPSPPELPEMFGWDKLQHSGAFVVHAFLAGWTISAFTASVKKSVFSAFVVTLLFGALIELLQATLTTTRSGDLVDIIADAIGAAAGCLILWYFLYGKCRPCNWR